MKNRRVLKNHDGFKNIMNIIVFGCNGKMGKTIINMVKNYPSLEIIGGVDRESTGEYDFPVFSSPDEITVKADAIIDFSNPSLLDSLLDYCTRTSTPPVICTTGFSETQVEQIKKTSEIIPIFYSRNMSLGINLLLELAQQATKFLGSDFDIEIIEKHHNQKIDAPSGTALMLAEEISPYMSENPDYVYDRTKVRKPRSKNEIGIHCVRGGNICGDHEVMFAGTDEIITLSHHASSRDIFASGALKAALFIAGRSPGLYTMKNLIGNI